MLKHSWMKSFLIIAVMFMAVLGFTTSLVYGQGDFALENKGKMNNLINLQTETLQKLFAQKQKIDAMGKEEAKIAKDIETLTGQITALQRAISEEEIAYNQKKEDLKQLLQSYQKIGPGSYLEIILDSSDLTDFLRRLNILRNITRNTDKLMQKLQSIKEKQEADQTKLSGTLTSLKGKQAEFAEAVAKENLLKTDLEDQLASLLAEKDTYQQYLTELQNQWAELRTLFSTAVKEFSTLMEEGKLPPESFKVDVNFLSIKGSITDKALNEIIAGNLGLPQILFRFEEGNVEMSVTDKSLILKGTFVIQNGNALKFQVKEGSFYGIPLESEALKELFQNGELVINLTSLLRGFTLASVETMNGYLQIAISPQF